MKRLLVLLAAVLAALMLGNAVALAAGDGQTVTSTNTDTNIPRLVGPDGRAHNARSTAGGIALVDPTASNGPVWYWPNIIQNTNVIAGSNPPDSSGTYSARGASRWQLWCYPTFDDSTAAALFAVQVRIHRVSSGDSLATFSWVKRWAPGDTCLFNCASVTATADTLWSVGNMARGNATATGIVADSLVLQGEFPWAMAGTMQPRGRFINLCDNGGCVEGDYIDVRVRLLNTLNATGRPYGRLTETRVSYKFSLVGYR